MKRLVLVAVLAGGCSGTLSAREHGKNLLGDTELSDSPANVFACSDCHEIEPDGAGDRILPGYTLVDSAYRVDFWGGYERTLLESMTFCRVEFMRGVPFEEEADDARAILEYLLSVSPTNPADALPLTVPPDIPADFPRGDPEEGRALYDRACAHCHGDVGGTVPKRFREEATAIPDDPAGWDEIYAEDFPGVPVGEIVLEKVRHGRFFDVGGVMPMFSVESLSDEEVAAILAFLGI